MADNRDPSPLGQLAQRRTALAAYPTSVRDGRSPGAAGDPLRRLQAAARSAGDYVARVAAARVVVLDDSGCVLLDVLVPPGSPGEDEPGPVAGWVVTDRCARCDGAPVALTRRQLDVLRLLVGCEVASTDDLRAAWGGYRVEDGSIRWQVGELRKALKKQFGDFPGELIESTGVGYRLALR